MSKFLQLIAILCFFTACNSDKSTDTSSTDTSSSDNSSDNNNNNDNTDTDTDDATPSEDCTQAGDFVACATCFAQQNPNGASTYNTAVQDNCVCANECIVECEAACEDPNAMDQTCNTCVNTVGADQQSQCFQGFASDCGASQDCATYSQQLASCPQ